MAGLFALLYGVLVGTATAVDNYQVWNENSNQRAEALREGKPYYYGARGTTYMTSTNEQCVRFTNKNGDRCLYSLDLKRELYNFDAVEREKKYNNSLPRFEEDKKIFEKVKQLYFQKGKKFYPIRPTWNLPLKKFPIEYFRENLTRDEMELFREELATHNGGFEWCDTFYGLWIYRESDELKRYYVYYKFQMVKSRPVEYYVMYLDRDKQMLYKEKMSEKIFMEHRNMEKEIEEERRRMSRLI